MTREANAPSMGNRTIYVRPGAQALFEAAELYAERNRLSLSALIAVALDEYLGRERANAQ
jgi:hypothetical protein